MVILDDAMIGKLLYIETLDSETEVSWESIDIAQVKLETGAIVSTGFLIGYNDNFVLLAGDFDVDNQNGNRWIRLPRSAIIRIQGLRCVPWNLATQADRDLLPPMDDVQLDTGDNKN